MVWSQDMDKIMLQEMAAEGVLHHKLKSRSRGNIIAKGCGQGECTAKL